VRLPRLEPAQLNAQQRALWDKITSGPRGGLRGPYLALLQSPRLCGDFEAVLRFLRFECSVHEHLRELSILVVARRWKAQYEWFAHAPLARRAGVDSEVVEAIRTARTPHFAQDDERAVYEFVQELATTGFASDAHYQAVHRLLGDTGIVELVALVGEYTAVALILNAFEIDVPEGAERPIAS
jgi:4-carboxymuconolactone decarboxylase